MPSTKAFTLIELLIVIMIIGILSTITLQLDRGQIQDMEAMNDREQRLSRHRAQNNTLTNTNFINGQKISTGVQYIYSGGSNNITRNISGTIEIYKLNNHTISGNLTITKYPLSLGCTTTSPNRIELIGSGKPACFSINTDLCLPEICKP